MKTARWICFCLALTSVFSGCDSSLSIKDPNDSFFVKFYGGDGDQTGKDFVLLPDGSIILFGTTRPSGTDQPSQWYLVKADGKGNIIWEKTFGDLLDEEASDIELTSDGNIVLAGTTRKTPAERDVFLMTITVEGVKIDSAVFDVLTNAGTPGSGDEMVMSVTELTDGGFIVAGSTTYSVLGGTDALNMRFTKSLARYTGSWPFTQTYGFPSMDVSTKIVQVDATDLYVFGYTNALKFANDKNDYNFWAYQVSLASMGTSGFDIAFGSSTADERMTSLFRLPPNLGDGYVMSGTSTLNGLSDVYVTRLPKILPPAPNQIFFDKPLSMNIGLNVQDNTSVTGLRQEGFLVLTDEATLIDNQNWLLTKLDNNGSIVWKLPIIFGGEGFDTIGAVQELSDGRIALLGTMRTGKSDVGEFKMTLIKVNSEGKFQN